MKNSITIMLLALAVGTTACDKGGDSGEGDKTEKKAEKKEKKKEGLSEGDAVVAKYGSTSFYEGTVKTAGDTVEVKWKDGSKAAKVAKKHVMAVPKKAHDVSEGDFVLAKWSKTGSKWWGAKVLSVGDKVKVRYVSDASESSVAKTEVVPAPKDMVPALKTALANAAIVSGAKKAGKPDKPSGWSPAAGQEVVAIWAAYTWYQGTVTAVSGGKPTVKWKDGSKPSEVDPAKIVPVPTDASTKAAKDNYVLVAPKSTTGFATWKYGKVTGVNGDKIDVQVQDGTKRSLGITEYLLIH